MHHYDEGNGEQSKQGGIGKEACFLTEVVVPRLDLDLSEDERDFDQLNKMFSLSVEDASHVEVVHGNNELIGNRRLENSLRNENEKASRSEMECVINQLHRTRGNDRAVLLHHLKYLNSLEKSEGSKVSNTDEHSLCENGNKMRRKARWFKRKHTFTKKEMLKLSLESLEKYFEALAKTLGEVDCVSNDLKSELERSDGLETNIKEMEANNDEVMRKHREVLAVKNNEIQQFQIMSNEMKETLESERKKWKIETGRLKTTIDENKRSNQQLIDECIQNGNKEVEKAAKIIDKLQAEKKEAKISSQAKIDELEQSVKESNRKTECSETKVKKLMDEISKKSMPKYEQEVNRLEDVIINKESDIINLSEKLMTTEQSSSNTIRNLKEEVLQKDKELIEVKEKYRNQILITRLLEKDSPSEDKARVGASNTGCNRCQGENEKNTEKNSQDSTEVRRSDDKNGVAEAWKAVAKEKEKNLEGCEAKHQNFIDTMMNHEDEAKKATRSDGLVKAVAILKVEDVWEEQILCHKSNVEKLREMQSLRKNLIRTSEELEQSMQENLELKNEIRCDKIQKKNNWSVLLNKQIFEMQRKDNEIDNLRLEMVKSKEEKDNLSKQLKKCLIFQRSKEMEIELLNVTLKEAAESEGESCRVTAESMRSLKATIKKLREENQYLLKHSDEMEQMMKESQQKLAEVMKLSKKMKLRGKHWKEKCAKIEEEMNHKDGCLKRIKHAMRQLQIRYENRKEEMKDRKYELFVYDNKLEKNEKRLQNMQKDNEKLERKNSILMKKAVETERDLQNSLDVIYAMKKEHKNAVEKITQGKERIKQVAENLVQKENEVKRLHNCKKSTDNEIERLAKELGNVNSKQEEMMANFESQNEELRNGTDKLELKLANVEEDLSSERNKTKQKESEIDLFQREIKDLKAKVAKMRAKNEFIWMEEEVNELKAEINDLRKDKLKLTKEKKEAEDKMELFEAGNETLKKRVSSLENENNQLFGELKEKEKEAKSKDQTLSKENESLQLNSR